jgi:uncharacterized cupredoxin-like copper-binding protein
MRRILIGLTATLAAGALVAAGLATGANQRPGASTVKVGLATRGDPTKLTPSTTVTKAGRVTFIVHNYSNIPHKSAGVPDVPEGHELVVLRTNLAPDKLRINQKSGSAIETGRVGKPVVLDPGKSGSITLNLTPGKYVLICNLTGHYAVGQHAGLTVVG